MVGSKEERLEQLKEKRTKEVLQMFEDKFEEIRKSKIYNDLKTPKKNRKDLCTLYLDGKMVEISNLRKEIETFQNPGKHFTKPYRTLEGHCSKLQTDLDGIDIFGRDELRLKRKDAFIEIDDALKLLKGRAHDDGMVCSKCEVKN